MRTGYPDFVALQRQRLYFADIALNPNGTQFVGWWDVLAWRRLVVTWRAARQADGQMLSRAPAVIHIFQNPLDETPTGVRAVWSGCATHGYVQLPVFARYAGVRVSNISLDAILVTLSVEADAVLAPMQAALPGSYIDYRNVTSSPSYSYFPVNPPAVRVGFLWVPPSAPASANLRVLQWAADDVGNQLWVAGTNVNAPLKASGYTTGEPGNTQYRVQFFEVFAVPVPGMLGVRIDYSVATPGTVAVTCNQL